MADGATRSLNIAYVGNRFPSLSETFVYREWLGLRQRGHAMTAISVRKPRVSDPGLALLASEAVIVYSGKTLLHLPLTAASHPRLVAKAFREALTGDIDGMAGRVKYLAQAMMGLALALRLRRAGIRHVHAHLANVAATVGLHLARGLSVPFSFTGHAADLFLYRAGLRLKLKEAAFVASISYWHQDFYARIEPGVTAPVVRCGVSLPAPRPAEGNGIVTVGRLVPKKGVDLLLRALAGIPDSGVRARIAGDGPERPHLERLAGELGLEDRVEFLGAMPHADCLELINEAALFVLPCRTAANGDQDGIPVVLMEAMAAGKAVIAGELPTIQELVHTETNGILVPAEDVAALAAAIGRLLGDRQLRLQLGRSARARIEEEFLDELNLERIESAIRDARSDVPA